ncbi:hypothetical protein [Rhizobium sp.]|uniref:hypothetical protein n=1 Tax=Rhizobium sp. TaxID=391 RepID=UPI002898DDED
MSFQRLKSLAEVQNRLASVLEEKGLRARYTFISDTIILFENADKTLRAATVLRPGDGVLFGEPVPGWSGSTLDFYEDQEPIGKTGWTHGVDHCFYGDYRVPASDNSGDLLFRHLENELRERPLIKMGNRHPDHTNNPDFNVVYEAVREGLGDAYDSMEIRCERSKSGIESFVFRVSDGQEWRTSVSKGKATFYVDGKRRGSFEVEDMPGIRGFVENRLEVYEISGLRTR